MQLVVDEKPAEELDAAWCYTVLDEAPIGDNCVPMVLCGWYRADMLHSEEELGVVTTERTSVMVVRTTDASGSSSIVSSDTAAAPAPP